MYGGHKVKKSISNAILEDTVDLYELCCTKGVQQVGISDCLKEVKAWIGLLRAQSLMVEHLQQPHRDEQEGW